MLTDEMWNAAMLCGSVVKWLLVPALDVIPAFRKIGVGRKRACVLVLSVLVTPIFYSTDSLSRWLLVGLSSALVAIGQHHLFQGDWRK